MVCAAAAGAGWRWCLQAVRLQHEHDAVEALRVGAPVGEQLPRGVAQAEGGQRALEAVHVDQPLLLSPLAASASSCSTAPYLDEPQPPVRA